MPDGRTVAGHTPPSQPPPLRKLTDARSVSISPKSGTFFLRQLLRVIGYLEDGVTSWRLLVVCLTLCVCVCVCVCVGGGEFFLGVIGYIDWRVLV